MKFTDSQQKVIDLRKKNILVSAAAGSGKTAVLVERIIRLITDEEYPVDIDRMLIVTFTNAAAAEMRERIGKALEEKLDLEPENENLLRQSTLLHHSLITTIDSFCLFLLKNHFHEIGLDPGFRVADPGEIELLKQDCLKEILEELLEDEKTKEDTVHLFDTISFKGREREVEEAILKLHRFSESFPWPEEWLNNLCFDYCYDAGEEAPLWEKELEGLFREKLQEIKEQITSSLSICKEEQGPYMYMDTLLADEEIIDHLAAKGWRETCKEGMSITFQRISSKKDPLIDQKKRELVKNLRDNWKKDLEKIKEEFFPYRLEVMAEQMKETALVEKALVHAVLTFRQRFIEKKREKNLLDFSDMEHLALELLVERVPGEDTKDQLGIRPTKTALEYRNTFAQIMIDEYQDSNMVQEYLLAGISGEKKNRFMVGDLKQSIYKFRLARPEIFLEKYETYDEEGNGENQRIDLHQNFRSRKEVVDTVNDVFYQIMQKEIGKIDYTEKEALNASAVYPESKEDYKSELLLIEESEEENKRAEALAAAAKIKEMEGVFLITDKASGELRPARYEDFVILLRTNAGWDEEFYDVLMEQGIPCVIAGKTGYFEASEVQTLLNFLRTLDNPRQDIPLYATMKSFFGGFTEEEIAGIKGGKKQSLFQALAEVSEDDENQWSGKAKEFLQRLTKYRDLVCLTPIHQLLRIYLKETGFLYHCMALPGGEQRASNIEMMLEKAEMYEKSSYFGLFHFIRYMEQLEKYQIDVPEAGNRTEGANAVRILSIHKSKGLEFPICFLCGLAKKINQRDASESMICDMDLGLGMEYRNVEKRIRRKDIRRNLLAAKIRRENLGEELRILYVAMTRAKEKLIMTGLVKDIEKKLDSVQIVKGVKERKLPLYTLSHSTSYLDLLLYAFVRAKGNVKITEVNRFFAEQFLKKKEEEKVWEQADAEMLLLNASSREEAKEMKEKMKEQLTFTYDHKELAGLYVKTSVSELKKKAMDEINEESVSLIREEKETYLPRFIQEKQKASGTVRGNAYHRVMELMDFRTINSTEKLWAAMELWEKKNLLKPGEKDLLTKKKMEFFFGSSLYERMTKAQEKNSLRREQPFVLGIPAKELNENFPKEEKVLIQGIIDAYFEEEQEIVLVDYKTDLVKTGEELILRYKKQMELYCLALTKLTGKRVKECILYSFGLNEEVCLSSHQS